MSTTTIPTSPASEATLDLLPALFDGVEPRNFAVRLWDGSSWAPPGAGDPAFTLVIERPSALRSLLRADSEAALAEAHLSGHLSIEGDIFAVPPLAASILARPRTLRDRAALALRILKLPRQGDRGGAGGAAGSGTPGDGALPAAVLSGAPHSPERDRAAVTHHYDVSNRFYGLFLDPAMVYSCAVFREPDEPLATAQRRKLDLICRKLRLREGDRLLDIGCGWGALILHAVREYGVRAVGITLSERQAEVARARVREAELDGLCTVQVRDYRTLDDDGAFDALASVGMFEHVGRARAPEYFATLHRLLRPGGRYLHHAITVDPRRAPKRGPTVTSRYVFPDNELIPVGETITFAEEAGFDVRDMEGLREHYALTLRRWVAGLEAHHDEAVAEVGEATWRAWRLVFAGAAVAFESGQEGLAQLLMVKPHAGGDAGLPLGRWDWYPRG